MRQEIVWEKGRKMSDKLNLSKKGTEALPLPVIFERIENIRDYINSGGVVKPDQQDLVNAYLILGIMSRKLI